MSLSLILFLMIPSPFSLCICNFYFQQWETWLSPFTIHPLNCLAPVYLQSRFRIFNSYPLEMQLYQLEYSVYVQIHHCLFSVTVHSQSTVFQGYLAQKCFLPPPQWSYVIDSFLTVWILSWLILYLLFNFFIMVNFYGFDKCIVS